jgi:hypothetical protein
LTTPQLFTASARRLAQERVADPDRAVATIERSLVEEGPLTRKQLGERVGLAGQALVHVLLLASLRGLVVRGPMAGREQAYVLVRDWLGKPRPVDRGAAFAELARRYLAGHGPGAPADLAAWSGLPLRDARAGLGAIASELAQRDDDLVDLAARDRPPDAIPSRLLPAFDPYLLGWKDRSFAVASAHATRVHPGGGMLRATATVDGLAVGTWKAPGGRVELELFAGVAPAAQAALRDDAADVERFVQAP